VSTVLDVRGLTHSYGARTLFDSVDLSVAEGEKVGVIGRNGSGKSTLFRILAGIEGCEEGTIALRRDLRVGYLPQEPDFDPDRTVFETAGEGRGELASILDRYQKVNRALAADPSDEEMQALLERQAALSARIDAMDGWDVSHRVESLLTRLGVEEWDRPMRTLSGGEARRVALVRTLVSDPELLLLDEPTNHLDADTVLWLEETLFDFRGAALIITHDRYFLDRVVDRMLEISPAGLVSYEGGYTEYLEARTQREERERVEEARRSKLIEKELAWARRSPPARTGKQKARRSRARDMEREQRELKRRREGTGQVELEIGAAPRLGRTILELHDIDKAYDGEPILRGFSDRLLAGERIGVVGPNGAGKTTLLRIIVGEETPDAGEVVLGHNTRIGYFDQDRAIDPEVSVARAVSDSDWVEPGGRRMHLRAYLERFLFPTREHDRKVATLSGGERNRLLLARLFLDEFNLLVLDEPTNDLDLDTLQLLEEAIEEFAGCVLLVTHDRFLLDKLATSLLVFEGGGKVSRHHGSWDAWLARREAGEAEREERRRAAERRERDERSAAAKAQAQAARSARPRLSYREQKELEKLTARIGELEGHKDELAARLADPAEFDGNPEALADAGRRFHTIESELEELFERWMELEER